jgi:hypothetical protein
VGDMDIASNAGDVQELTVAVAAASEEVIDR